MAHGLSKQCTARGRCTVWECTLCVAITATSPAADGATACSDVRIVLSAASLSSEPGAAEMFQ